MGYLYKTLVSLEDLPSNFHVDLDENFRKFLFEKARSNETWIFLAKKIRYSRERLTCLKRGYRTVHSKKEKNLININLLKELSKISHTSLEKVKKHVVAVRIGRGKCYSLKLPINESTELASVTAHSFGDGHLNNSNLFYYNENEGLVKSFVTDVKKVFGYIEPIIYYDGKGTTVVFPVVVAQILSLIGGVKFNKTLQDYDIPSWVKNSSKEIKASFIRGLFDDESSLDIEQREIIFQMSNNKKFILSVLEILAEFGIKCSLRTAGEYRDKNNYKKIMYRFAIGKFENLLKYKNIGFEHTEKQKMLIKILEDFQDVHYLYEDIEKNMIDLLLNKGSLTTKDLMKELNRSDESIRIHLNNLHNKNLIIQINNYPSTWKIR